jgi:hypothetical protein
MKKCLLFTTNGPIFPDSYETVLVPLAMNNSNMLEQDSSNNFVPLVATFKEHDKYIKNYI